MRISERHLGAAPARSEHPAFPRVGLDRGDGRTNCVDVKYLQCSVV